jgi:hypothetical protein
VETTQSSHSGLILRPKNIIPSSYTLAAAPDCTLDTHSLILAIVTD